MSGALEIITALNTLLQLLATQGISLQALVDEYEYAQADGVELSVKDIELLKEEAAEALAHLAADLAADST